VEALRVQGQLFGQVASDTTCGRALGEIGQVPRDRIAAVGVVERGARRGGQFAQAPVDGRSLE
jgi:hypothetical protein